MRVIDLFAGPGGLAEGFSSILDTSGRRVFKVVLSIEKSLYPFRTLNLRSFYRQFPPGKAPKEYYAFMQGKLTLNNLLSHFPNEASCAEKETWLTSLGDSNYSNEHIDVKISNALSGESNWFLIGGPPCQAYSLVGRSRNQWSANHNPEEDHPYYFLYREYIRVIEKFAPVAFVMENVPGLFSVITKEGPLISHILERLTNPGNNYKYCLYSMSTGAWRMGDSPRDFIVESEKFGLPQARHRIIVFGVRSDIIGVRFHPMKHKDYIPLQRIIGGLPPLRSGLSKRKDTLTAWKENLKDIFSQSWFHFLENEQPILANHMRRNIEEAVSKDLTRGGEFLTCKSDNPALKSWYVDSKIKGQCHHYTRGHQDSDLWRYLFSASSAQIFGRSPRLEEYPKDLLPAHENVFHGKFNDRFRVQSAEHPAKTITSHISQDGHYFIHYDPVQCRSLTVREAARIQTFPDNYYFCGGQTSQFEQIGNAVPPYLAFCIAKCIYKSLKGKIEF